jgi:hypothetical protein
VPGRMGVKQREQLVGDISIAEFIGGAGAQRPHPPQEAGADGVGVGQAGVGVPQGIFGTAAGGGGEGVHLAVTSLVFGVVTCPQGWQGRQQGIGGLGLAAQRREPGPVACEVLVVG